MHQEFNIPLIVSIISVGIIGTFIIRTEMVFNHRMKVLHDLKDYLDFKLTKATNVNEIRSINISAYYDELKTMPLIKAILQFWIWDTNKFGTLEDIIQKVEGDKNENSK